MCRPTFHGCELQTLLPLLTICWKLAAGLVNLRKLNLNDSWLTPANLAHFSRLTYLSAASSQLDNQALAQLGPAVRLSLHELHLADNPAIDAQGARHLSSLQALTLLDLSGCAINSDGVEALARVSSLAVLEIQNSSCGLDGDALAPLSQLTNLHSLNVSCDDVDSGGALHIGKCTQLQRLTIGYNQIGDEGLLNLLTLARLQNLDLSCNCISSDGAYHLPRAFRCLTSLEIHTNNLGIAGASFVAQMTQLRHLQMHDNPLGAEGVQVLRTLRQLTNLNPLHMPS